MEVEKKEDKTIREWVPSERSYGLFCLVYVAIVAGLVIYFIFFQRKEYVSAGLIIGSIYVVVALYYFYEQFLVPYLKEKSTRETESEITIVYSPNILAWLVQWLFPALFLQVLLVFGFWISIERFPFKANVYTSPYEYGLIYDRFDALAGDIYRQVERDSANFDSKKAEEWESFLVTRFSGYLRQGKKKTMDSGSTPRQAVTFWELEGMIYKIPFMIAFAFGFLGALIYTLKDTAYRFYTVDMYPKTYVGYIIRFFFAPSLCMVLAYFMSNDWLVSAGPIIFFMIGFFPQTAFRYIEHKGQEMLKIRKEKKEGMPLDTIQGMTDYIMFRFRELGVDDVQNLANVDLTYLRRNMGYSNRLLADFIAQALLILYFVDDFDRLRAAGIRDVLSFEANVTKESCQRIAELVKIGKEKLQGFLDLLESESMKERVETLRHLKCETDIREREQMQAEMQCR